MIGDLYPDKDILSGSCILKWFPDLKPYPLRVSPGNLGLDPRDRADAYTVEEFHCYMFDLTNEEDLNMYKLVKQRIISGWYTQLKEISKWESSDQPLKVWLEWVQSYKEI